MKIVHLVAGAGKMYCGSCLAGNTLCRALQQAGHDVVLVPVYTPIRTDEENVSVDRVALGGLNVFLQQQSRLARRMPGFVDRVLDHPALLGRLGGGTRPERLGPLAVSMLRGEEGNQQKEVDKLVDWLDREIHPELIHLSTALLVGAARTLTERLGVPIVSSLSGEDGFIERLPEPYRTEARHELRTRCADLAALVAPSEYYAGFMAEYLAVPRERITVIRPGLDLDGHAAPGSPAQSELLPEESEEIEPSSDELPDERLSEDEVDTIVAEQEPLPPEQKPITIGYLSRVCPTKGLHQLVEAFRLLLREPAMPPMRLRAAGHLGRDDRVYFRQIRRQLSRFGLTDRFEYVGELRRAEKIAFLQSLDILSVPATRPESKGLAVLEALANGTPAVLPDHGVFSELIAETSGGLVHEPNRPSALAVALERMIRNPALVERCGREGQEAIRRDYDVRRTAERMVEFYGTVCKK